MQEEWESSGASLDVGFEFDAQIVWLSRPKPLRQTVQLSFMGASDEQVDLAGLLSTLSGRFRDQVVRAARAARKEAEEDASDEE
jgi:hypothetical protein